MKKLEKRSEEVKNNNWCAGTPYKVTQTKKNKSGILLYFNHNINIMKYSIDTGVCGP